MPIGAREFCDHYPRLYYMAHEDAWSGIQRHGLLSTSALLDLFELDGDDRYRIESCHRPESVAVRHPIHGQAVIRDQKPLSESALTKCLRDMKPRAWYETLNRKVFFWLDRKRLNRLLVARAYRASTHCVLTLDTTLLLGHHLSSVTLSPINSGSTIFDPQPRGLDTFSPLDKYPFSTWARKRGIRGAVAELAVDYAVPDVRHLLLRAEKIYGEVVTDVLFST